MPLANKLVPMLIFAGLSLLLSCKNDEKALEANNSILSLFSSKDRFNESGTSKVLVKVGNAASTSYVGAELLDLREWLNSSLVSSGDQEVAKHGANRSKIGSIGVEVDGELRSFALFQSESDPLLFAVEIPDVESSSTSVTFWRDLEGKHREYFAGLSLKREVSE